MKKVTQEAFEKRIFKKHGKNISVLGKYISAQQKVLFRCNVCNCEYETLPNVAYKHGCKECNYKDRRESNKRRKTHDDFISEIYNVHGDKITILGKYKAAKEKVLVHCNICEHEWYAIPGNIITNRRGCPACTKSSNGERVIREYLKVNNYTFAEQYRFEECRDKHTLPFDFAVFTKENTLAFLIEYDGAHHYVGGFYYGNERKTNLEDIQNRDRIKDEYCKNNNLILVRIKYERYENPLFEKRIITKLEKQIEDIKLDIQI